MSKDTEEEKASISLALFPRHAQLAVIRNLRSEALGRASTKLCRDFFSIQCDDIGKLKDSEQGQG